MSEWTPEEMLWNALTTAEGAMNGGIARIRKDALHSEVDGNVVDTCCAYDTHKWETGVKIGEESFVIVEDYPSKSEAVKGHARWVEKVKGGERKFKDIHWPDEEDE